MMPTKFECLRCGECCRNFHIESEYGTLGLFLMPNERKLFLSYQIRPLYGAGIKGRSRPRPQVTYAYQIVQNTCPHLTEENLCAIYEKRPVSCKSFPLGVMLDRRCIWVKQHYQEGESTPKSMLDLGDLDKYEIMLFKYIGIYAEKYPGKMWAWDLKTKKWRKTKW